MEAAKIPGFGMGDGGAEVPPRQATSGQKGSENLPCLLRGDQWRPVETNGDQWRPVETSGDQWRPVETSGDQWRPVETSGAVHAAVSA